MLRIDGILNRGSHAVAERNHGESLTWMWNVINGETQLCRFDDLPNVLPKPAKIQVGELTFVVVDYDV